MSVERHPNAPNCSQAVACEAGNEGRMNLPLRLAFRAREGAVMVGHVDAVVGGVCACRQVVSSSLSGLRC
jgi:hypothetical protein